MSIIEYNHVSHVYFYRTPFATQGLDDVTLTFDTGKIYTVVGRTGSGKTTLLKHMNGLLFATQGSVSVLGNDVFRKSKTLSKTRQRIGYLFQFPEHQLFANTVREELVFSLENYGISYEEEQLIAVIERLQLEKEVLDGSPFDLSGGQKRRVALASLLLLEPDIFVFDEPTAGLDPEGRRMLIDILIELKEKGKSIFIISHNIEELVSITDEFVVMEKGRLKGRFLTPELLQDITPLEDVFDVLPARLLLAKYLQERKITFTSFHKKDLIEALERTSKL